MKLESWMIKEGLLYASASRRLHLTRQQIYAYIRREEGKKIIIPNYENMRKIFFKTESEVTPLDFYLEPEEVEAYIVGLLNKADAAASLDRGETVE